MDIVPTDVIDFNLIKNENARHTVERMMDKNPKTRATLTELLQTDWVTNNRRESLDVAKIDAENLHMLATKRL